MPLSLQSLFGHHFAMTIQQKTSMKKEELAECTKCAEMSKIRSCFFFSDFLAICRIFEITEKIKSIRS